MMGEEDRHLCESLEEEEEMEEDVERNQTDLIDRSSLSESFHSNQCV